MGNEEGQSLESALCTAALAGPWRALGKHQRPVFPGQGLPHFSANIAGGWGAAQGVHEPC